PGTAGDWRVSDIRQRAVDRLRTARPARLCVHLYAVAQAIHAEQHRHRWRRGRTTAACRLGSRDERSRQPHGLVSVRDHLFLDTTALLGAVTADPQALRARWRANAARPA